MKQKLLNKLWLRVGMIVAIMTTALSGTAWAETYSLTPNKSSTGSSATTYITTLTEFTYNGISWKMNQWNPSTLQIKTNQSSTNNEFFFYNSSAFPGKITKVVITFSALTVSDAAKLLFKGGTTVVSTTGDGTAGTWNSTNKTLTWTPGASDNFTYFAFYQNGKAASGTNYLADEDAIVVTYETGGDTPTPTTYTVTYDANGGTGTMTDADSPYESGATVTVLANGFTRTDYDFTGWNTAADGTGTGYDEDDTFTISANTTLYAQWEEQSGDAQWVLTSLSDLTSSDVFVIVGNNGSNYALSSANGTSSAPPVASVTIEGSQITSSVENTIKWTISGNATDGYTFHPNGDTNKYIYCTNANNGVRVGTPNSGTTEIHAFTITDGYLTAGFATPRYVGIYNSQDWRCYNGYTSSNIANQTFAFYKKVTGGVIPPSITASNIEIAYDATNGSITYSVANPVEGGVVTATSSESWLTVGTPSNGTIALTCAANSETTARTATVTLTYTYNTNETVTTTVTVTQAAAPVIYTTIPALFAAATSTATDVNITFGGWVVSAVHSNNAYLTDNQGNGLIIYASGHGFQAGDVLTGTVSCKLQLYRGSAELTELTTSTTGLSVAHNGTVTEQNITISELSGMNTGALLAYQGLTFNGTALVDVNDNAITPYNTLSTYTLESGKTYNVKGIYQQYNSTKEILPRSAADIVEVVITTPAINVASTTIDASYAVYNGTINVTYENFTAVLSEVIFCDANGSDATYDWITAVINNENNVEYHLNENTGEARTAYMKVYALDDEANELYSDLITITQAAYVAPPTGDQYELFSGNLVEGDYIIYYDGKAMNTTVTSDRLQYVEVTPVNDVITTGDATIVWHIAPSGNYWTIYNAAGNAYAASTGVKNKAQMLADGTDDMALWEVSDEYEFVNKKNSDAGVNAYLRNNGTYGFACYAATTGGALSLYKKVVPTESVKLNASGYATFSSNNAVSIPADGAFTAWQITNIDSDNKITFVQVTGNVKAETGLFLKGDASDEITIEVVASGEELTDDKLVGFPNATNVNDGEYYGLSGNQFVKVTAGTVKAGKALLPAGYITESNSVKPFTFVFEDDATGIEETLSNSPLKGENIYNLAGQMVNGKSVNGKLPKGIYIVNGKKILK